MTQKNQIKKDYLYVRIKSTVFLFTSTKTYQSVTPGHPLEIIVPSGRDQRQGSRNRREVSTGEDSPYVRRETVLLYILLVHHQTDVIHSYKITLYNYPGTKYKAWSTFSTTNHTFSGVGAVTESDHTTCIVRK